MGEARNRGTAAQRIAEAHERMTLEVERARKDMGYDESAKFCGFVIYVPETDDYLGKVKQTKDATLWGYVRSPENALKYEDPLRAHIVASELAKRAVVGVMFDLGSQFGVAFNEE